MNKTSPIVAVILMLAFNTYSFSNSKPTESEDSNSEIEIESSGLKKMTKKPFKIPKRLITPYPWGVGFGAIFSPNPYVDTRGNILPIPIITYQGEDLTFLGPYLNYRFFRKGIAVTSAQIFLYPARFTASESNNPNIQKLNDRNFIVLAGIKQEFLTDYVNIGGAVNFDITGQTNGYLVTLSAKKPFFIKFNSNYFIFTPSIGIQYSSEHLTNYFYGISTGESQNSGLDQYAVPAALSPFVGLTAIYSFNLKWNVAVSTKVNRLDNNIIKSPMVSSQYVFTTFVSLTYNFSL